MEAQDEVAIEKIRVQNNPIAQDYKILPAIYHGPYGEIRQVESTFHGKERCLKIIRQEYIEEDQRERIMQNVGQMQSCVSDLEPGMLKVYEFYQDENCFYMI